MARQPQTSGRRITGLRIERRRCSPVRATRRLDRLAALLEEEGKSILFSTHITSDLERIADYITFVRNGRVAFSTSKEDLLDNWAIVKGGRELADSREAFVGVRQTEVGVEALTSDASATRRRFNAGCVFERASLEDIMFFLELGDADDD